MLPNFEKKQICLHTSNCGTGLIILAQLIGNEISDSKVLVYKHGKIQHNTRGQLILFKHIFLIFRWNLSDNIRDRSHMLYFKLEPCNFTLNILCK